MLDYYRLNLQQIPACHGGFARLPRRGDGAGRRSWERREDTRHLDEGRRGREGRRLQILLEPPEKRHRSSDSVGAGDSTRLTTGIQRRPGKTGADYSVFRLFSRVKGLARPLPLPPRQQDRGPDPDLM